MKKKIVLAIALVACIFIGNQQEKPTKANSAEKIVDYSFNDMEDSLVPDQTGNFDGAFINPDLASIHDNSDTGEAVVSFEGGTTESYIEIPEGVLDGLDSVTVSTLVNWQGGGGAQWVYGLGQSDTHYMYYTPSYVGGAMDRLGIATNSWQNESFAQSPKLANTEWKLVTTVVNGPDETLETYIDGELVASGSTNGYTLEDIRNENGISGYIAKSFYDPDPYFGGMIADFEIYNDALPEGQINTLYSEAQRTIEDIGGLDGLFIDIAYEQLGATDILKYNEDVDHIETDLNLPTEGAYGMAISWETSHPEIISPDGKVERPSNEADNQTVTLTAIISDGKETKTKEFTFIVIKRMADDLAINEATENLTVHHMDDVRGNLYLPTTAEHNVEVSWESSNPDVISPAGDVSRPAYGEGNITVTLTANLSIGSETATKQLEAIVQEHPEKIEDNAAYLMTYFHGENYPDGEQIRFAYSDGNDVTEWHAINNGDPVLTSSLGEQGLRDPSIIRSPEGDKFYLLATDLKVYGTGGDWARTVREGSNSLMIWESTDLVNWSEQRMVEVSQPEAGMTWAPEVYYDHDTGEYIVYWSSFVYDSVADRYGGGSSYNRIMYAKTRDFYNFTEPQTLLDLGHDILDTVAIDYNDKVYRFTKGTYFTEKELSGQEIREHIFQDVGDSFFGDFEFVKEGIGMDELDHGEGAEIFKSNTEEDKFYLLIDEFGNGRGYTLFETTDIASADWKLSEDINLPDRPRHGDVLSLTEEEYQRLQINIPGVHVDVTEPTTVESVSLNKESITLVVNASASLDATVLPEHAVNKEVTWSSSNEAVATVDQNGQVVAVAEGEATITVTTKSGNHTATTQVIVSNPVVTPSTELIIGQESDVLAGEIYTIQGMNASITMPADLPENSRIVVRQADLSAMSHEGLDVAGENLTVELSYPEDTPEHVEPFQLVLGLDDDLSDKEPHIYYYDEAEQQWLSKGGERTEANQTISLALPHFSTYGVFVESEPEQPSDPDDQDNEGTTGQDGEGINNDGIGDGSNHQNNEDQSPSEKESEENHLPDTATSLFNKIWLGVLFILLGFVMAYRLNKRHTN